MSSGVISIRPESRDAEARERICHSLDESLIVEAAAGTGKTTVLVQRMANILQSGRTAIDRVVAVTFTHKAAGEMKLRLRHELDHRLQTATGVELNNIEHALAHLEEASMGTIHNFCGQILHERPVEANIDPLFRELSEVEAASLYGEAFRRWFEDRLNSGSVALQRALVRRPGFGDGSATDRLRYAGRELIEWRDHDAPWMPIAWDRNAEADRLVALITEQAKALNTSENSNHVHSFVQWVNRYEEVHGRNYDLLENELIQLRRRLRGGRPKIENIEWELERFRKAADQDLAQRLRAEMQSLIQQYEETKRKFGRLDFLDLLIRARDLVRDNEEVRRFLHDRFTHFFVDEFQDTDPLQAELFLLLTSDDPSQTDCRRTRPAPGRLFVVGDPKQSIYKFRRADVRLYERIRGALEECGVGVVKLTKSFRAVPTIQEFVNDAFEPEMTGDESSGQARYVPLERASEPIDGQPPLVFLPVPYTLDFRNLPDKKSIEQSLPEMVAGFIKWLVSESGYRVREGGELVPIRERHICILFRRMWRGWDQKDVSRDYTIELEKRGIAHVLIGSRSFYEREEVMMIRAALAAIEWPDDTLSVYATLRGALFAFSDGALFEYIENGHRLHAFGPRPGNAQGPLREIADALDFLGELHKQRNRQPAAVTVSRLLETSRAAAVVALRPGGSQLLGNLSRVLDLARNYETSGGSSFRGFVELLEEQAIAADSAESPVIEEGADGVRVMSTHRAKGLEFPVVILADITTNLHHLEPERYVDPDRKLCAMKLAGCMPGELSDHQDDELARERAEGIRVSYVAATRARDLLVIPAVKGFRDWMREPGGWLQALDKVVHSRDYAGYWFSLDKLPEAPELMTAWQTADLLADAGGASEGIASYEAWRAGREKTRELGKVVTLDLLTPSLLREEPPSEIEAEVVELERDPARPSNRRFGTLLHAGMRLAETADVRKVVEMQARILGATAEETEAAITTIEAAFAHSLLERARRSKQILRESPITFPLGDGRVLDGVIDLAFEESGTWTVVDFKTGHTDLRSVYLKQVRWYAHALSSLTGLPARAVLMEL